MNKIQFLCKKNIAHIILNAAPNNLMDSDFFYDFDNIITNDLSDSSIQNNNLCGVIIYGVSRHFSAGASINYLTQEVEKKKYPDIFMKNLENFKKLYNLRIPVISLIQGVCIGSGFELALSSHFRFCTKNALLGLPETTFDFIPGVGGIVRLNDIVGKAKTIELTLTADNISSFDALEIGLVDKIITKNTAIEYIEQFIENIYKDYNILHKKKYLNSYSSSFVYKSKEVHCYG